MIVYEEQIPSGFVIGGFAPGNYMNQCAECNKEFVGDKRAQQCLPCAAVAVTGIVKKYRTILASIATNTCCTNCQEAAKVAQGAFTNEE